MDFGAVPTREPSMIFNNSMIDNSSDGSATPPVNQLEDLNFGMAEEGSVEEELRKMQEKFRETVDFATTGVVGSSYKLREKGGISVIPRNGSSQSLVLAGALASAAKGL